MYEQKADALMRERSEGVNASASAWSHESVRLYDGEAEFMQQDGSPVEHPAHTEVRDAMAEGDTPEDAGSRAPLSPAAERALAEAEARRAEMEKQAREAPKELGRKGPDPARYGDWEKNGIVSDF